MSATRPTRETRSTANPKTTPADLALMEAIPNRDCVNVGEGRSAFLLGQKGGTPGIDEAAEEHPSPGERLSDDVHDLHHVHASNDGDILAAAIDPGAEALADAIQVIEEAIAHCAEEPAILASEGFAAAGKLVRERDPGAWYRLRVAIKRAKPNGVLLSDIDKATRPEGEASGDTSTADALVSLVQERAELFHAEDGACFAVLNETPRKTFRLDTQAFAEWLGYTYYRATEGEKGPGRAASDTAIRTARVVLTGIAKNDGDERKVFLRAARLGDVYYLDLGGEDWRGVEISAVGWRLVERPPVHFWRATTTRPLPVPVPGGDLTLLWRYANIPEEARPLVKAWILEAWRPETPFPILELIGQQGTAKSSTQDKLRRCIDPNAVNLRAAAKSVEDLFVSAGCNWLVSLNNLSHLTPNVQDALCNLATGGGFAGRTLYTNADETLVDAKRPVVINGIVPLVTAQDLTDRIIHIELPEIATYRSETEIDQAFAQDAPLILGGLLDLFVLTLRHLPTVTLDRPPRMADFTALGEAMLGAEGQPPGAFLGLYQGNRRNSVARSLDASPVASAIRTLAEAETPPLFFEGTMGKLLDRLSQYRDGTEAWPKSARGLGDVLRRQRPALAQIGISVTIGKPGRLGVPVAIRRRERGERGEHRSEVSAPEKMGRMVEGEL